MSCLAGRCVSLVDEEDDDISNLEQTIGDFENICG
jgi:hypothetical protein